MIDRYEIARQLYDRDFGTEAARDEWIAKRAAEIEAHLNKVLATDVKESESIGTLALSIMTDSNAGALVRLRKSTDMHANQISWLLIDAAIDKAIKVEAEHRATLEAEAMTPNDYLPD